MPCVKGQAQLSLFFLKKTLRMPPTSLRIVLDFLLSVSFFVPAFDVFAVANDPLEPLDVWLSCEPCGLLTAGGRTVVLIEFVGVELGIVLQDEKRRDGKLPWLRDELNVVVITVVGVVTVMVLPLVRGVVFVFVLARWVGCW